MIEDLDLYMALTHLTHAVRLLLDNPFASSADIVRSGGAGSAAYISLGVANDEAESVVRRYLFQRRELEAQQEVAHE